jgi:hypothetical protein
MLHHPIATMTMRRKAPMAFPTCFLWCANLFAWGANQDRHAKSDEPLQ